MTVKQLIEVIKNQVVIGKGATSITCNRCGTVVYLGQGYDGVSRLVCQGCPRTMRE